ncbi:MAG TPA: hypothetical protein VG895_03810 [Patescibacteria group bacterium]|nr:hypothetical protein [Patescibacteria group bacterium]
MANKSETPKTGKELHEEVEKLRENGHFWKALKISYDAIAAYINEKNYSSLSDLEGSISLTYRHLFNQTGDKNYLVLAESAAECGIEIAKFNNLENAVAIPTYNLAKVQEEMGSVGEAAETYEDALEVFQKNPPQDHNRPGVLADMKIHAFTCQYKAGDKSALPKVLSAIEELQKSGEETVSKYNYDVWLSGAHIKLAEALKDEDKDLARKHLDEAKKIIDGNADLKLRKEQWEKLSQNFS